MPVIVGTPWARRYLTPEDRDAIAAMVRPDVVKVSLAAGRAPGDWSARLFIAGRHGDPLGVSHGSRTIVAAVGVAAHDMALGAPLAWCSACPDPAIYQHNGEAYCRVHEVTRGGAIS